MDAAYYITCRNCDEKINLLEHDPCVDLARKLESGSVTVYCPFCGQEHLILIEGESEAD